MSTTKPKRGTDTGRSGKSTSGQSGTGRGRKTRSGQDGMSMSVQTSSVQDGAAVATSETVTPETTLPENAALKRSIQEKAAKKRTRPDSTIQPLPGDNTRIMRHSLAMMYWQKPDMKNRDEVWNRILLYFDLCAQDDVKPTIEGLSVAFAVDRTTLWKWVSGGTKSIPREVIDTLKIAYNVINSQMADYMLEGKVPPLSGIFLMRNNMGYSDKTEIVVSPASPIGDTTSHARLAETYLETIVEEDPEQT